MKKIHDKFVKASFSDPSRATTFFEKFLPAGLLNTLDLQTLKPFQESYLQDDLKEFFSDMVFEVALKDRASVTMDIVLLFEHKSAPDKNVVFQIGSYMFSRWMSTIRQKEKIKPIIPIIYYQGKKKWKIKPMSFNFKQYPNEIKQFLPDVNYLLISLQTIPDESIEGIRNSLMAAAILSQKNAYNPITLANDLIRIFRLFPDYPERNFLQSIVVYLFKVSEVPKAEWIEALNTIPTELKENLMTTYSWIKEEGKIEGKIEGKLEGEKVGELKEKAKVVLKSFQMGLSVSIIANITELTEEEVENIILRHQNEKK